VILDPPVLWLAVAGALVATELATGTFYLLMLAPGCLAASLAAYAKAPFSLQLVAAALVGGATTAAWHFRRARAPRSAPAESNRDVNLDIGQAVQVDAWAADGSARVSYRGAAWSVRYAGAGEPAPGLHVIVAIQGSELRVTPRAAS
jgi:membrane protein implicated in regulation of membrane protease activity